jgi:hypothetical protein
MHVCIGGLGGAHSACGCEGAVNVEEADGVLDRALGERRDDAGGGGGGGHDVGWYFSFCSRGMYRCMSVLEL